LSFFFLKISSGYFHISSRRQGGVIHILMPLIWNLEQNGFINQNDLQMACRIQKWQWRQEKP